MVYSAKVKLYFIRLRKRFPEIDEEIRQVLTDHTSPETSISLRQFVEKYTIRTGKIFPLHVCAIRSTEFLLSVPFVVGYRSKSGTLYFFYLTSGVH
ncbi:PREDICTED: uncharacterized protein LOC108382163 [Rhagoletis zephyria]|uniref:uncharacterized protein LOC108382163 n=1 Tax=Rhagoletis zephyria TaxID=28612 RepID=UPI0008119C1A|nr:PREDICTED: uncharacterized protein LOC108382163 [Rhagoletis zephyria]